MRPPVHSTVHPPTSRDLLAPGGPIAARLGDDYEPRPQQAEMAAAVERAMDSRSCLLAEAGTGVGKSFAYLVPAILRCLLRDQIVVVATNTISLQEQLISRDIPLLRETLDHWNLPDDAPDLRPVLVKGRGNYLSVRRLELASKRSASLPDPPSRRSLRVIEQWAYATLDGTLSTLPALERPGVWDRVQSDSGNCMGRSCPRHDVCFYQNARREMERGNLLVCNHALFFSDLALRARDAGFLPNYHHVVLDEAHNVEDAATEHFGVSLTRARVHHLLATLYHHRTGKGYLPQLRLRTDDADLLDGAHHAVLKAGRAADRLFDDLSAAFRAGRFPSGRIPEPGAAENPLSSAMRNLALRLRALREEADDQADRYELNAYAQRASAIADDAQALIDQTLPGCVYWLEITEPERGASTRAPGDRVRIACSPVEVGPLLREHLFSREIGIVLTSATLSTGASAPSDDPEAPPADDARGFELIRTRLGIDEARTVRLGSPFDLARQVELHIDHTMPQPGRSGDRSADRYESALADRVITHARRTDGGAFVLFTSLTTLRRVAETAQDTLEGLGYTVLVQGRDGARTAILDRFRDSGRAVLFGAASFWQGVDVRGEALRCVIITRLPFEPPDRPLTQARLERIEQRGGNPFMEESLPRALIRFKQGFGRLIRSATDSGRVVVLDPRIRTARYGRAFLATVPPGVRVIAESTQKSDAKAPIPHPEG